MIILYDYYKYIFISLQRQQANKKSQKFIKQNILLIEESGSVKIVTDPGGQKITAPTDLDY
jgi:hypothetical protein